MTRRLRRVSPALVFLLVVGLAEVTHLWPARQRLHELQPVALAYGATVLLAAALALGLVIGNVRRGLVFVGIVWTCMAAVSIVKRRYLGAPLYPWDLLRLREVVGIWEDMPTALKAACIAAAALVAAAFLACVDSAVRFWPDPRSRLRQAAAGSAIAAVVLLPFHPSVRKWFPGPGNALSVALHLRNVRWWPENNYQVNGFAAGFLISLDVLHIPRPPVAPWPLPADCEPTRMVATTVSAPSPTTRPDVIVLLLESFFDPLTLGIPISRDPIPFLRTMMEQSDGAELDSTLWAHGTANAEFEILTGLSTAFLPPDSVVFFHYLHAPLHSLASEFRRAGYRAEAIHPNPGWFYARTEAYRWLGFDRAWFQQDFVPPREARARISDDRVFFAQLRARLGAADGTPQFLWGVSLGTHGPYADTRAPRCDLRVGAGADPEAGARFATLRTYVCLLERLDRRLQEFVSWLQARGSPYVLFAYGDHLPPLGQELDAYRESLESEAPHGGPRFSRTPLLLASNVDVTLPRGYHGGFNFLPPAILRAAGLVPRCQFELLDRLHARVDLVHAGLLTPNGDANLAAEMNRYWALTYRLLMEPPP